MPIDVLFRVIAELAKQQGLTKSQFQAVISAATFEGLSNDDETTRIDMNNWLNDVYPS